METLTVRLNQKGIGTVEALIAGAIVAVVALGTFSYFYSVRTTQTRSMNNVSTTAMATMIGSTVVARSGASNILNNYPSCSSSAVSVTPAASRNIDPFCCTDGSSHCTELRRSLLCGEYPAMSFDTQRIRNSATWARNLYEACMGGPSGSCAITDNGGSICTDQGLIFDSPEEVATFLNLLPDPIDLNSLSSDQRPQEARLKIEVVNSNNYRNALDCGDIPSAGWNMDVAMRVTVTVGHGPAENRTVQSNQVHLNWPRDPAPPAAVTNTEVIQNAGLDNSVNMDRNDSVNADNWTIVPQGSAYYRDGSLRAGATCTGFNVNGLESQSPEYTYEGWTKLVYEIIANEGGSTFVCYNGLATSPSQLNMCCDAIGSGSTQVMNPNDLGSTELRVVWENSFNEGDLLAVGIMDATGNISSPRNFIFSPGYCPPTNSYCPSGSVTNVGPSGLDACGGGRAFEGENYPINCDRPHDGCFGRCPAGTRSGQNCPFGDSELYCSVGVNFDSEKTRGCAEGTHCTIDTRCNDTICDDCGADQCPSSTIEVDPVVRDGVYANQVQFPTEYLGKSEGGCPDRATYCSVNDPLPSSVLNSPNDSRYYLPKDKCGNSCPDGARPAGLNCPAVVYDPVSCGDPQPKDDCGRDCTVTHYCNCPEAIANTCEGEPAISNGFNCGVGTKAYTNIQDKFCGNQTGSTEVCTDSTGSHYRGSNLGTMAWGACPASNSESCETPINQTCTPAQTGVPETSAPTNVSLEQQVQFCYYADCALTLDHEASPNNAFIGEQIVVTGHGFPTSAISAGNVIVTLHPPGGLGLSTVTTFAAEVITGTPASERQIRFTIPGSMTPPESNTNYRVSIHGTANNGTKFQSTTQAKFILKP